ncbi:MAG: hypothetical protein H6766_01000 [Candidatus Peribacteria bacterium]|nr:MAG: hypothetical protein H6766_01000 [Candidatus Peribacteria bacterium]
MDVYPGWRTIVDEMWDVWVVYDDYIPILPYFNCSVGFTRGGQERR